MEGRYRVRRIYRAVDGGDETEWYGINDIMYTPEKPLMDWTKRGVKKFRWKGTKTAAEDLCDLMNRGVPETEEMVREEMSLSQRIMYQQQARKPRKTVTSVTSAFKRCRCGAMYKGEKHCGS